MTYRDITDEDLLTVITPEDLKFVQALRIPYQGDECAGLWARFHMVNHQITVALKSGKIKPIPKTPVAATRAGFYVQSDYVPGGEIQSMVDGRKYDSKSKYYKSVKEAGLHVVGNDSPVTKRSAPVSDLTHKDVKDAIERLKAR